MAKEEHVTHSYIRSHFTDDRTKMIFKCAHPICTHTLTVPKKNRSLIIGRASLCPQCKVNTFILTAQDITRKVPKCMDCKGGKKAEVLRKNKAVVMDVLNDLFGKSDMEETKEL